MSQPKHRHVDRQEAARLHRELKAQSQSLAQAVAESEERLKKILGRRRIDRRPQP